MSPAALLFNTPPALLQLCLLVSQDFLEPILQKAVLGVNIPDFKVRLVLQPRLFAVFHSLRHSLYAAPTCC